eukprot:3168039-Rhodomonas_salina.3
MHSLDAVAGFGEVPGQNLLHVLLPEKSQHLIVCPQKPLPVWMVIAHRDGKWAAVEYLQVLFCAETSVGHGEGRKPRRRWHFSGSPGVLPQRTTTVNPKNKPMSVDSDGNPDKDRQKQR